MSRLAHRFAALKAAGRKALIPYITAGDPEPGVTVAALHALVKAGADVLELGVPFSDPMADGPTITFGHERALKHGVSLRQVLAMVSEFRQQDDHTPVVLMGYLNPVEIMGVAAFADAAKAAGVDGVLTVDLPPEEAEDLDLELKRVGLDPIYLLAPTTSLARAKLITDAASGYVYYVSLKGVTGAATLDTDAVAARIAELRSITQLPIGVGFGIKDATTAAAVARHADGVVVGSVLVQRLGELAHDTAAIPAALTAILAPMRAAIDQA
ncbi:tryptophan synthase subunit alpha [Perlucidibaca aquatica]|uniref:tryptophan synthase subunit alpha n=1 Tax=Perlucidibaca aquatica TaxID=1852776 RepID=UPI00083A9A4B|nr:tryptophan synthase subunit alpha [Perlucidibaca aquatica]